MRHVATIQSTIQVKADDNVLEPGFYELEVHVSLSYLVTKGDPKGWVKREVARHLAGCIEATGLPMHEGLWDVRFTDFACKHFNLPRGFTT